MAYTTIDDPSAYFHTQLYTGNGTAIGSGGNVITNNANSGDFKPDWTWHKVRSTANDHQIYDSSRGVKIRLNTNATNSDFTLNEGLQSFDTNGFTVGSDNGVNQSSQTFVAWQWKANGGTTASNTDGTITSTVQANTTAGFSIVTYTGNGSTGATIGHGLGAVPSMFIIKRRSGTEDWVVYHHKNTSAPETDHLLLNLTDATADSDTRFNDTAPTSTLITMGNNAVINASGSTYVGYAFAEKQGYSKFGSYTGNGNADGPFIYTGFKPAWLMIKKTNNTSQWVIHDTTRQEFNMQTRFLQANQTIAESTSSAADLDILSNGFKLRSSDDAQNGTGDTYIYMAFAESPFVSSEGVPTTAR
jgi:hypothetical protein